MLLKEKPIIGRLEPVEKVAPWNVGHVPKELIPVVVESPVPNAINELIPPLEPTYA
jgi:hypothetical protein